MKLNKLPIPAHLRPKSYNTSSLTRALNKPVIANLIEQFKYVIKNPDADYWTLKRVFGETKSTMKISNFDTGFKYQGKPIYKIGNDIFIKYLDEAFKLGTVNPKANRSFKFRKRK